MGLLRNPYVTVKIDQVVVSRGEYIAVYLKLPDGSMIQVELLVDEKGLPRVHLREKDLGIVGPYPEH